MKQTDACLMYQTLLDSTAPQFNASAENHTRAAAASAESPTIRKPGRGCGTDRAGG